MANVWRAEESGGYMAVLAHLVSQTRSHDRPHRFGQHVEVQSQNVCRLRRRDEISGRRKIGVAEGLARLGRNVGIVCRLLLEAQHGGRLGRHVGRVGKETLLYEGLVCHGRNSRRVVVHTVEEPVAIVPPRIPEIWLAALADDKIDPCLHARELVLEYALVAVGHIVLPRHDCSHIGPARMTCTHKTSDHGYDIRNLTVGKLIRRHVLEPLAEETLHVAVERSRTEEDLCIARPAQTLVTLRAVGRYVDEIAAKAPLYVALELVNQIVR